MKSGIVIPSSIQHKSVLYGAQSYDPFFQIKAVDDDKGIIQAYASKFDNVDEYKDVVLNGAYLRTLKNQRESKRKYLYVYLFQHDPNLIVGGIQEAEEDKVGLLYQAQCNLDTQLGRETYSNAKMGVLYQSSIGYDVPSGGAEYKDGIRYLKEIRLWEISLVTFAANPEATVVGVKQSPGERPYEIQGKSASGTTDWPLGDRNTAWDGAAAHNAIVKWAAKDDGSIDEGKMKGVHFWYDESAPENITSYKLLFCTIQDGKPIAMPRAIFACAGSRGVATVKIPESDMAGVKAKIASYYKRMAEAFEDDTIKVPWSSEEEKGTGAIPEKKDFNENYGRATAHDLLEDWYEILLPALSQSMCDCLCGGGNLQSDMQETLSQFSRAAMQWMALVQQSGLQEYLQMPTYEENYEMMRAHHQASIKAGRSISAANSQRIQDHAQGLHQMADKAMAMMDEHCKSIKGMADELAAMLQKPEEEDTQDSTPQQEQAQGKSVSPGQAHGASSHSEASTVNEQELEAVIQRLRGLRSPAPTH